MAPAKHDMNLKTGNELHENSYFQSMQVISAIPEGSKFIIKKT